MNVEHRTLNVELRNLRAPFMKEVTELQGLFEKGARLCQRPAAAGRGHSYQLKRHSLLRLVEDATAALRCISGQLSGLFTVATRLQEPYFDVECWTSFEVPFPPDAILHNLRSNDF